MSGPRRIWLVAGEPSGDRLAAAIAAGLRQRWPEVQLRGLAGPAMRGAGVEAVARVEEVSVMGLVEVLRHLPRLWWLRRRLQARLRPPEAELAVFVDAPDLCLPLARSARQQGVRTVVVGSPQLWAWRPGRAPAVLAAADRLLCLFAFEPPLYAAHAAPGQVAFVGHPALDLAPQTRHVDPHHWAILPGSRRQELRRHLGPFLATTDALRRERPSARFTWVVPPELAGALPPGLTVVHALDAIHDARGALSKSGTVTLELAARGVPLVVAHRVHPLTHWLARRLVTGVEHIALPNLLDPAHPVPEHVQQLDPAALCRALLGLPAHQPVDLRAAGGPEAVARMVEQVVDCWEARP